MRKRASKGKAPSEARLFPVCGWFCGQRQEPKFKPPKIVAKNKQNTRFSREKRVFYGAAGRIRTADLILTKRPWNFFLTIFCALWLFPLQATCFPSLFEHRVSAYSAVLCGWLCGQTVWGCNFRNLTVFTNIAKAAPAVFMSMPAIHKKRGVLYPRTAVVPSSHKAFSLFHDSGIAGL